MKAIFFKSTFLFLISMFVFNYANAQEKILYVIFTSIPDDGEGICKGLPTLREVHNYQPIIYEVFSVKYKIAYPFIHTSYKNRTKNLEIWDKPQSYLVDIKSSTVDWDVIKQGFTHKMDNPLCI